MTKDRTAAPGRTGRAGGRRIGAAVTLCTVAALVVGCAPAAGTELAGTAGAGNAAGVGMDTGDAGANEINDFAASDPGGADPLVEMTVQYPAKYAIDGRDKPTNNAHRTTDVYLAGDLIGIDCQIEGDLNGGSRIWDHTTDGYYIPDWLVKTGTDGYIDDMPRCLEPAAPKTASKKNESKKNETKKNESKKNETPTSEPTRTAQPRVVAMGDSFGSGEGAGDYVDGTDKAGVNECHQSAKSWQRHIDLPGLGVSSPTNPNIDYEQVTCSGAVTKNILDQGQWGQPRQLDALQGNEKYVLLSIGGNDLNFAYVISSCLGAVPVEGSPIDVLPTTLPCWAMPKVTRTKKAIDEFLRPAVSGEDFGGAFVTTIRKIHKESGGAKIVLAGYPQIFGQPTPGFMGCFGITRSEAAYIDRLGTYLSAETAKRVADLRSAGIDIVFAETITEFAGHQACTGPRQWLNSLAVPIITEGLAKHPEFFHPNARGQQAYQRAVERVLR